MALLLGIASAPVVFLLSHARGGLSRLDVQSVANGGLFALEGAAVATAVGTITGLLAGTREFRGRTWVTVLSVVPVAAPPAFWWIGLSRMPLLPLRSVAGLTAGALVAGIALSPVTFLLVLAGLREFAANLYEAARLSLSPVRRLRFVLLPLLRSSIVGGFLLTVTLLLGESEIPFLFGFRTVMTDAVTAFSQTFDVAEVVPLALPLVAIVLLLGMVASRPVLRTLLSSPRGGRGVARKASATPLGALAPAGLVVLSLVGYASALAGGLGRPSWPKVPVTLATVVRSLAEPVACAWVALALSVGAAYPARASRAMPWLLSIGLLIFCIPAAILGIGWIGISEVLGGAPVHTSVAHTTRAVGLASLGFAVAFARLPKSLERAARLVPLSPPRRALSLVVPPLAPSFAAVAALVAALTYADRDVASILLPPGSSRLMLDFYLESANAPSSTVGGMALVVFAGAVVTGALAAIGPLALWRSRG